MSWPYNPGEHHRKSLFNTCYSFLTFLSAVLSLTPLPGGYSASVPPVPFPNTEVKCGHVDGSATYVCVRVDHCRAPFPKTAELKFCGFFISIPFIFIPIIHVKFNNPLFINMLNLIFL